MQGGGNTPMRSFLKPRDETNQGNTTEKEEKRTKDTQRKLAFSK